MIRGFSCGVKEWTPQEVITFETWEVRSYNTSRNKLYACVCVCVFKDSSEPSIVSSMCKDPEVGRNLVHLRNSKAWITELRERDKGVAPCNVLTHPVPTPPSLPGAHGVGPHPPQSGRLSASMPLLPSVCTSAQNRTNWRAEVGVIYLGTLNPILRLMTS